MWTKEKPEPPEHGSDWYWYWDTDEKRPWVVEIYKGCWKFYVYQGYWWDVPISRPKVDPDFNGKMKKKFQGALSSMPTEDKK